MSIKAKVLVESIAALVRDAEDFDASMRLVDARASLPPMRWAIDRVVAALPDDRREALRQKTLEPIAFEQLQALPTDTFGRAYVDFFRQHHISETSPFDSWPKLLETTQSNWVLRRMIKTHDMHHVLLGFGIDVCAETGLMAFTTRNYRDPHGMFAMVGLPLLTAHSRQPRRLWREVRRGWALGEQAQNLFVMPVEDLLPLTLTEARRRCGIAPELTQPVRP